MCVFVYTRAHMRQHVFSQTASSMPENLTNKLFVSVSLCPFASNKAYGSSDLFPFSQLNPFKAVKLLLSTNIRWWLQEFVP